MLGTQIFHPYSFDLALFRNYALTPNAQIRHSDTILMRLRYAMKTRGEVPGLIYVGLILNLSCADSIMMLAPSLFMQGDDMAAVGIQALHIDELLAIWLILMRMVVLGVMHLVLDMAGL
ncbi:unnamed protein product [Vicia faba]|uniref:Uncharacterized protein n=1 Tax=Vicia faba TaxID=3906 RepID=A0AAV0ZM11_VICFA|nr:unnamed protein product [Vicia faba]